MVHTDINDNEKKDYTEVNKKINTLNNNLSDLEFLGWEVPKECPIQNEYSNGVFTQKVGRIDLSTLNWTYASLIANTWGTDFTVTDNIYSKKYTYANWGNISSGQMCHTQNYFAVNNGSSTEKPSGYLYYELTTPIIHKDGAEITTQINQSLSPHTITGTTDTNGNMNLDLLPTNVDLISVVGSGVIVVPFVYDEQYIVKALDVNSFLAVTETEITLNAYYKNK